jgi:hypothetical protein
MGCFERLVRSKFLANVSSELSLARERILVTDQAQFPATINFDKSAKKSLYKDYVYFYYLIEEMSDSVEEALNENLAADTLFFIEVDHISFVYSTDHNQVREAVKYSYNTNGLIPIYKGRHKVRDKIMYTALMDTRIQFTPIAPN